jgi:SAM-dependent methyltransferase
MSEILLCLQCPISGQSLVFLSQSQISQINQEIEKKRIFHVNGQPVERKMICGLISLDGNIAYFVEDDILFLHDSLGICLGGYRHIRESKDDKIKQQVKSFYDEIGWKKNDKDFYDAVQFEDLRPVCKEYIHKCNLRVKKYIQREGKYLLDVASGPLQYSEYLTYSETYEKRICVDISLLALREAKRKIDGKGIFILGDITKLPLKDCSIDAVISMHTIYHVPASEQRRAFEELNRVLKSNSYGVVIYSWGGKSFLMRLTSYPVRLFNRILMLVRRKRSFNNESDVPPLYFYPHDYEWFTYQDWSFKYDIYVWRSVNINFMKSYLHRWLGGRLILKVLFWFEEEFPSFFGKHGQYPMIIISK